jgi:hypothetical protein
MPEETKPATATNGGMSLVYTVQNPSDTTASMQAEVNGKILTVMANAFECELIDDLRVQGTIKLRFVGDQMQAARDLFKADSKINVSFAQ